MCFVAVTSYDAVSLCMCATVASIVTITVRKAKWFYLLLSLLGSWGMLAYYVENVQYLYFTSI